MTRFVLCRSIFIKGLTVSKFKGKTFLNRLVALTFTCTCCCSCFGQDETFDCATAPIEYDAHDGRSFPGNFVCGNRFRVFFWILRDDNGLNGIDSEENVEDYTNSILSELNAGFNFPEVNLSEINSPYGYIDTPIIFESAGWDFLDNTDLLYAQSDLHFFIQFAANCDAINLYVAGLSTTACGVANNISGEAPVAGLWVRRYCALSTYCHEMGHEC